MAVVFGPVVGLTLLRAVAAGYPWSEVGGRHGGRMPSRFRRFKDCPKDRRGVLRQAIVRK
jgi:hypothetical protein